MALNNKYQCTCLLCHNIVTTNNLSIHYGSKQCQSGKLFSEWKQRSNRTLNCDYCNFVGKNVNSVTQHEIRCEKNLDKINLDYLKDGANFKGYYEQIKSGQIKPSNQYIKAELLGTVYEISEETRKKLSSASSKQVWTEERRQEHRKTMLKTVEAHPESYTSSNRGRTKQIIYDNIKFQGNWEVDFYKWCKYNNIKCERNTQGFKYTWNGSRTYYPDFYLQDIDTYIEVKGYTTERDLAKWEQFPKTLKVIDKEGIKKLRQNKSPL